MIQVPIGKTAGTDSVDQTRRVKFEGEELGSRTEFDHDEYLGTCGTMETLYRTVDDRLLVYVKEWSWLASEPQFYRLVEVTEADLQPGGQYEVLGATCGYSQEKEGENNV